MKKNILLWVAVVLANVLFILFAKPVFNIHDISLWIYIMVAIITVEVGNCIMTENPSEKYLIFPGVLLVIFVLCALASSPIFHTQKASSLADITQVSGNSIPEVQSSLPLMDTLSAEVVGSKELGALSELGGIFEDSDYKQTNFQGSVKIVSPLRYASFFKWIRQHKEGVPGYVLVDPMDQSATYVKLDSPMKYIPSACFFEDTRWILWTNYPTKMFRNIHFELDNEGNPYFVAPYTKKMIGLFGGDVIDGVIILDPVTKQMQDYKVSDVPNWVDVVYDGDLLLSLYNYHGKYKNGFWNSLFGQVGCKHTTNDFGYISDNNDILIFTGVTSYVDKDRSNLGFVMANERTGKMSYISLPGSDEQSVMSAAEGEVQEKGYKSSFPTLALLDDKLVYVLFLKDDNNYVKSVAVADATQVNNVVVGQNKNEAIKKFISLYHKATTSISDTSPVLETEMQGFEITNTDGETIIKITTANGEVQIFKSAQK